jgi:2-polyprenyl-3-methyl-5-hydroxy-6-metoxy-1,4-benzoquinol methylase
VGNGMVDTEPFDPIISIEVIEHLFSPREFIKRALALPCDLEDC